MSSVGELKLRQANKLRASLLILPAQQPPSQPASFSRHIPTYRQVAARLPPRNHPNTMATPSCSILERLPQELRDEIWKEVLVHDVVDVTPTRCPPSHPTGDTLDAYNAFRTTKPPTGKHAPGTPISVTLTALLRTCRQVRYEATRIFYAHNTFQINITEATLGLPARWLTSLPSEGRQSIRKFNINFGAGNEDLFSKLIRQTTSFDSLNMSMFVNAPRHLREKNFQLLSSTMLKLQAVENFKHSAISLQLDRQTAGMWEWVAWRQCWHQCLFDMSETFIMPERNVIGCDNCRRIGCRPRSSCNCSNALDKAQEA
jgi:hypothetical protein